MINYESSQSGVSWCPDCVSAEPFLKEALDMYGDRTVLVHVDVGDRFVEEISSSSSSFNLKFYSLDPHGKT